LKKPFIILILKEIGGLNQGGFLPKLGSQNTQQFIRKYNIHPIHFSEPLEYCYDVKVCFRGTLAGVVKAK
jgi:hypothetical protein